jgi:hypothetical protein
MTYFVAGNVLFFVFYFLEFNCIVKVFLKAFFFCFIQTPRIVSKIEAIERGKKIKYKKNKKNLVKER